MIDRNIKLNVLNKIPEIGVIGSISDEILYNTIKKEDTKFKEFEIKVRHLSGVKLIGALTWNGIQKNKDITYIKKILEESTNELRDIKTSFKCSNGMNCELSLVFYSDGTILDSIETKNRFVLNYINVKFLSQNGTEKILNAKDNILLKDNIEKIKIELERYCTLLVDNINKYSGSSKLMSVIKV